MGDKGGFDELSHDELNLRILDAMPGGLVHVSAEGAILHANAEALRLLGLTYEIATRKFTQDFGTATIREDGTPCPVAEYPVTKALSTGEPQPPVTIGVRRPDGTVSWAIFTAVPVLHPKTGAVTGAIVTFLDITARRAAEEALRESEARFRSILESAPNPIVLADVDGTVLFINRTSSGVRKEQVVGAPVWKYVAPEDQAKVRECMERVLRTGEPGSYEIKAGPEGHTYAASVGPVKVGDRIVGTTFVAFDTTELRELQARVAVSDRLASIGTLAAGVAHEINNPLTYMLANMTWVERYLGKKDDSRQALGWMREALEGLSRIRDIVADLRSLTSDRQDHVALIDVRDILDATLRISQNELRHRARAIKRYADVPGVVASQSRLGQVFLNLLLNAAQSIPEGDLDHNEVRIDVRAEEGRLVVEISDTGVGIPPDLILRVFDPFVTTKAVEGGTGLGLYISRNIVKSLGGDLSVKSTPGKGSVFRVELPVAESPLMSDHRESNDVSSELERRLRILIIDDEPAIVTVLGEYLANHDVTVAHTGREAIAVLREHLAAAESMGKQCDLDVILCDLVMPDQTGMDVHEHVRTTCPGMERKIIFMTGGAFTERARSFMLAVSNTVLEKPFSRTDLMVALARVSLLIREPAGQSSAG